MYISCTDHVQVIYRSSIDHRLSLDDLDISRQTDHMFPILYDPWCEAFPERRRGRKRRITEGNQKPVFISPIPPFARLPLVWLGGGVYLGYVQLELPGTVQRAEPEDQGGERGGQQQPQVSRKHHHPLPEREHDT